MSEIEVSDELLRITEAIIFANGDPVTAERIARGAGVSIAEAHAAARKLQRAYAVRDGALEILTLNGAYQLAVKTDYSEHIRKTLDEKKNTALSNAAMETLAIAAYNCGPGNVNKAIRRAGGKRDFWSIYPYLPRETRSYLPIYIAACYVMNYADLHGICGPTIEMTVRTDTVLTTHRLHLHRCVNNKILNVK